MSEQMEVYVKARREWLPVSYLGERKADGITLVVWSSGTGVEFFDDDEMKNRLRPAISRGREHNRKFASTPHEPVEGVTLWCHNTSPGNNSDAVIKVDGEQTGFAVGYAPPNIPDIYSADDFAKGAREKSISPCHSCDAVKTKLTAFRDRIRQQRNAKAEPKDAPRTWTRAEIISIVESVK